MGLGILTNYFKIIGRDYYAEIPLGRLVINWIYQRIFRINDECPLSVHSTSLIQGYSRIKIRGRDSLLCLAGKGGCYWTVFEETSLEIGEGTIWAFNVCIQTGNHLPGDLNKWSVASVKIGRNCWLGNGSTILKGVTLGDNVIVGANSVVTKSFPSNVIIAGAPARVVRQIELTETIK